MFAQYWVLGSLKKKNSLTWLVKTIYSLSYLEHLVKTRLVSQHVPNRTL